MIGTILDEKFSIERELGRGGMGTVYLATHLGTERPVAIKVISPQFMERPEFVERFRREARAAGRLRHPNVVNVTDFGFAVTPEGRVAYLVMEYLDGCTLGEILEEEKNLPVAWTIDILEQVCSAVHEAHVQGIIHRDLKPDNIWLEPNQRGGYTVKVLDFGIAKLESPSSADAGSSGLEQELNGGRLTMAGGEDTIHDSVTPTLLSDVGTHVGLEARTAIISVRPESSIDAHEKATMLDSPPTAGGDETDPETASTRILTEREEGGSDPSTGNGSSGGREIGQRNDLTRVGAVLGTPLYMSPEQCRGQRLDPRSDIYSLGVIGYQMLAGTTPFEGDFSRVMDAHKMEQPPPFKAKKVRKKLRRAIFSALEKDPELRPQSAEAFATILRARSEGILGLLRRAGMIYTEHITKFLALSTLFHTPMILLTVVFVTVSIMRAADSITEPTYRAATVVLSVLIGVNTAFGAYLIIGTTTWIVSQSLAVPLRPIRLRTALRAAKTKWKRFAGTGILSTLLTLGFATVTCGLGFLVTGVLWTLVGPVVMMEELKGWAAIKRSTQLVRRSLITSIAAVGIMFLIPAVFAGTLSALVNLSVLAIANQASSAEVKTEGGTTDVQFKTGEGENEVGFNVSTDRGISLVRVDKDTRNRIRTTISETLLQIILLPLQIVMTSFTAIIVALLYLKTRQAGGEPLHELLVNFEESDQPRKKWQERVRQRLIQSGRITSKPTG